MPCPTRFGAVLVATLVMTGPAEAASIGVCGGGGGSQSKTLSCPAGQYIVGLSVRFGAFVDRIGIRCAKIDSAGKRGTLGAFQYAGGTGGQFDQSKTCPGNRAVVGIVVRSGSYVDRLDRGDCGTRQAQGGFVLDNKSIGFSTSGGGVICTLLCSEGEAVHRLIVRYGGWVDSIETFCRP